jgi:hypothetical protein
MSTEIMNKENRFNIVHLQLKYSQYQLNLYLSSNQWKNKNLAKQHEINLCAYRIDQ